MSWSIERVVAALTPVFAAAAGWISSSVAQLVPGVNLNKGDVTALFIAGATAAVGAAWKWLEGRQKFTQAATDVEKVVDQIVAKVNANTVAGPALSDIEAVVKSHTDEIIDAVGKVLHAPTSADEVAKEIANRLTQGTATTIGSIGDATQTVPTQTIQ